MSTNKNKRMYPEEKWEANTAEVAIFHDGDFLDHHRYVWGYLTIREVSMLISILNAPLFEETGVEGLKEYLDKKFTPHLYQETGNEIMAKKYVESEKKWLEVNK